MEDWQNVWEKNADKEGKVKKFQEQHSHNEIMLRNPGQGAIMLIVGESE